MTERAPDDLDLDFVPMRVEPDAAVELDGEEVLYVAEPSRLLTLNATARVVWHSLDGEVSVGALAEELATEFGVDLDSMRSDVLELVRELGRSGLLEGLAPDEATIAAQALVRKAPREEGDATDTA